MLFIREEEIGFICYLKNHKVNVDALEITWSKVANIQAQLESLIIKNYHLNMSGKEAFKGYIRAYNSHQQKDVFDISKLDLKKVQLQYEFKISKFHKK